MNYGPPLLPAWRSVRETAVGKWERKTVIFGGENSKEGEGI